MIDARSIQRALAVKGLYDGKIDGAIGPKTRGAIQEAVLRETASRSAKWTQARQLVAFEQMMMRDAGLAVGAIDGFAGPQTQFAFEKWQDRLRDLTPAPEEVAHQPAVWPRQKDVPSFYGKVGANQTKIALPYPMRLAWDKSSVVRSFSIHQKAHDSAQRALTKIHTAYGEQKIKDLRLDLFGGCLNVRKMRGGKAWSMHSWGIAIDFDPENNPFRMERDKAPLARKEYEPFWRAWEEEGWLSLGRERNFDWQHVQAARL